MKLICWKQTKHKSNKKVRANLMSGVDKKSSVFLIIPLDTWNLIAIFNFQDMTRYDTLKFEVGHKPNSEVRTYLLWKNKVQFLFSYHWTLGHIHTFRTLN